MHHCLWRPPGSTLCSTPRLTGGAPNSHPRPHFAGGPSWLQWGFACVRSRAFELRKDCFAFVPFLDGANHAPDPSCDFRRELCSAGGWGAAAVVCAGRIRAVARDGVQQQWFVPAPAGGTVELHLVPALLWAC